MCGNLASCNGFNASIKGRRCSRSPRIVDDLEGDGDFARLGCRCRPVGHMLMKTPIPSNLQPSIPKSKDADHPKTAAEWDRKASVKQTQDIPSYRAAQRDDRGHGYRATNGKHDTDPKTCRTEDPNERNDRETGARSVCNPMQLIVALALAGWVIRIHVHRRGV